MATPIVAFIVQVTEHERGWGSRPDGHIIFKTEADADVWLKKIEAERRNQPVPDEYDSYDKIGYKEVKPQVIEALNNEARGFIWVTRTQKFLKE